MHVSFQDTDSSWVSGLLQDVSDAAATPTHVLHVQVVLKRYALCSCTDQWWPQVRDAVAADGRAALQLRLQQAARLGQADVAAQAALLLHDAAGFRDLKTASVAVDPHGEVPALMRQLAAFY